MNQNPPTDLDLDEIATRAAHLYEYVAVTVADAEPDFDQLTGTDVGVLLAEVRRLRDELGAATEFRLEPTPPAYTPLIVRRDVAYDGTRWAVLHDPGDLAVRRVWTAEGWEMAWASPHDEIYCWPDAASALAAARQAQAEDDREPDVDGAGRTPESYRDHRVAAPVVAAVSSAAENGDQP